MFIIPMETIIVILTAYISFLAGISQNGVRTLWQHIGKRKKKKDMESEKKVESEEKGESEEHGTHETYYKCTTKLAKNQVSYDNQLAVCFKM